MGTEVLNQSDIDALLDAASAPAPAPAAAPPTQIFSRARRDRGIHRSGSPRPTQAKRSIT